MNRRVGFDLGGRWVPDMFYCKECHWWRKVNKECLCADCYAVYHPIHAWWLRVTGKIRVNN